MLVGEPFADPEAGNPLGEPVGKGQCFSFAMLCCPAGHDLDVLQAVDAKLLHLGILWRKTEQVEMLVEELDFIGFDAKMRDCSLVIQGRVDEAYFPALLDSRLEQTNSFQIGAIIYGRLYVN